MFAIAFDLVVVETAQRHPKGVAQAYADIGSTLANYGFNRVQGSLYTTNSEDLANLFGAIMALTEGVALAARLGSRHPSLPRRAVVGLHKAREVLSEIGSSAPKPTRSHRLPSACSIRR